MTMKTKMRTRVVLEPLAPQLEQCASFDLTVITSASSHDDVVGQKVDISIVPYTEDDEEAPPQEKQQIEKFTKHCTRCRSFSLSALKVAVILILVLLLAVFIVVLYKSGKQFGKW
jgi:hypothetical protein